MVYNQQAVRAHPKMAVAHLNGQGGPVLPGPPAPIYQHEVIPDPLHFMKKSYHLLLSLTTRH
jgi:hypothetical protein